MRTEPQSLPKFWRYLTARTAIVVFLTLVVLSFRATLPRLSVSHAIRQSDEDAAQTSKQHQVNTVLGEFIVRFREGTSAKRADPLLLSSDSRQLRARIELLAPDELVTGLRIVRVSPEDTLPRQKTAVRKRTLK